MIIFKKDIEKDEKPNFNIFYNCLISVTLKAQEISGRVSDYLTSEFLNDVKVEIVNSNSGETDSVFTDNSGSWSFTITDVKRPNLISSFELENNYPNPFNPSTTLGFSLSEQGDVRISIHDILGRVVDSKEYFLNPGIYSINYDGIGAAGVYFYTLSSNGKSITKKMIQLDGGRGVGLSNLRSANRYFSNLTKRFFTELQIVFSKFGYVNDTLFITETDNKYFETKLETLHSNSIVVDLHNDILERVFMEDPNYRLGDYNFKFETDIPRLQIGGVDLQFFAVWISPTAYEGSYYETSLEMINHLKYETVINSNSLSNDNCYLSSMNAIESGRISGVIGVEGGHSIENSMDKLITLYESGMRYLTITWNNSTDWAISAKDSRSQTVGLSDFGKDVIRMMDSLGIIIDVSHTGIKTISDILEISKNPIVATHSGARTVKDHYRNLYDSQIVDIANTGGVVGIVFYPPFIGDPNNDGKIDIEDVIIHIDYIVNLVGIDYIALGSDFDGTGGYLPEGLEDVTRLPSLTLALLKHGYSQSDVRKLLGENFLRVFKQVCDQ